MIYLITLCYFIGILLLKYVIIPDFNCELTHPSMKHMDIPSRILIGLMFILSPILVPIMFIGVIFLGFLYLVGHLLTSILGLNNGARGNGTVQSG